MAMVVVGAQTYGGEDVRGLGNETLSLKVSLADDPSLTAVSVVPVGSELRLTATVSGIDTGETGTITITRDGSPVGSGGIGSGAHSFTTTDTPSQTGLATYEAVATVTNSKGKTRNLGPVEKEVMVVGIDKIIVDASDPADEGPTYFCWEESLTLRALPDPENATFPSGHPVWSVTSKPEDSQLDQLGTGATLAFSPDVPGEYVIKAECGTSSDTFTATAVQVSLEPVAAEGWLLDPGDLCLNAQDEYKKAKWKATVLPEGTTATIELHGDSDADVSVPSGTVGNSQEFEVTGGADVGAYKLIIKHSDHQVCTKESDEGMAFRLKFIVEDVDKTQETAGEGFINVDIDSVSARSHTAGATNGAYLAVKKRVKIIAEPGGAFAGRVESAFKLSLATSPTLQRIERVDLGTDGSPVGFDFKFITVNLPNSRSAAALRGSIIIDDKAPLLSSQVEFSNAALVYWWPDEAEQSVPVSASRSADDLLIFTVGEPAVPVTFELAASSRSDNSNLKVTSNVAAGTTMDVAIDDDNEYEIVP